jgi:hypothetical protein
MFLNQMRVRNKSIQKEAQHNCEESHPTESFKYLVYNGLDGVKVGSKPLILIKTAED